MDEKPVNPDDSPEQQYTIEELEKMREHLTVHWATMADKLNEMSAFAHDTRETTIVNYMVEQHRVTLRLIDYIEKSLATYVEIDTGRMADLGEALNELQNKGRLIGAAPELEDGYGGLKDEPMEAGFDEQLDEIKDNVAVKTDEILQRMEDGYGDVNSSDVNLHCKTILTENIHNWPEWVTHIAMDNSGVWFGYLHRPLKDTDVLKWFCDGTRMDVTEDEEQHTLLVVEDPDELPEVPPQYWEHTLVQVRQDND